ncbi:MAG: hypothetical protein NC819_00040 [Candidatus Omnitrophica bacterium]|nr:hypothetical protein [Candidatus Omnitrophota bacterium]
MEKCPGQGWFLALCATCWLAIPVSVEAKESPNIPFFEGLHGVIRSRQYADIKRDSDSEETFETRNDMRLELALRFSQGITGVLSGEVETNFGMNRDDFHPEERTIRLFEAYTDVNWGDVDLRIGQQVIRWGKGDEINPIDNFTPENLKEGINLDRADRKFPVPAAYGKYFFLDRTHWEGIWIPFFRANLLAGSGQDWEPFFRKNYRNLGFVFLPERRRDRGLSDSVWATRLVHEGTLGDVSVSYAYHFDQNPSYEVFRSPAVLPPTVETVWKRIHSVGSDFEIAHEGWGFRGEAVYTAGKPHITFNTSDDNLVEEKNTFQALLGVDRTFANEIYANLQLIQDFILNHEDGMQARAYEASISFRVWKKFLHDRLKLQWTGRSFLTDKDLFYKVDLTCEIKEDVEVGIGVMVFEGESQGLFGQFDDNDHVFVRAKFSF